jgi:hypothetical protein
MTRKSLEQIAWNFYDNSDYMVDYDTLRYLCPACGLHFSKLSALYQNVEGGAGCEHEVLERLERTIERRI